MAWLSAAILFAFFLHTSRADEQMTAMLVNHTDGKYTAEMLAEMPLTAELIGEAMSIEKGLVESGELAEASISAPGLTFSFFAAAWLRITWK